MLKLIIEDDEGRKTVVPFVRDEITIGRQEGNTIRLTERNVSRKHARLFRQNGHIAVEDLGSYNGIRINGDKISGQTTVQEGDLIQIADYDLSVQNDAVTQTAPGGNPAHNPNDTMPVGSSARAELTTLRLDGATKPALPPVPDPSSETLADDEGPEEAHPDDVTAAPPDVLEPTAPGTNKNQSTAVIHMDAVEAGRTRKVEDIDAADAPRLVVLNTEFAGREFACIRTELRVGRTDDNDIAIDHRSLSRTHCKVVREDSGEWRVLDMESANGLMVNGESYAQATLRSGDVVELGHVKMKFVGPGEAFTLTATSDGVKVKTGSRAPMVIASVLLVAGIAGGGYLLWQKQLQGTAIVEVPPGAVGRQLPSEPLVPDPANPPVVEPQPTQPEPAVVKPDPDPAVDPAPPDPGPEPVEPVKPAQPAVDPEEQRILAERKRNEELLASADAALKTGNLVKAQEALGKCKVGQSPCPEAKAKLERIQAEKGFKLTLDKAERALQKKELDQAGQLLGQAYATEVFHARHVELESRFKEAMVQQMNAKKAAEAAQPRVQPVAAAAPVKEASPAKASETQKLIDEAREANKKSEYPQAKAKLLTCIKLEPQNADCHKLLGSTFALLKDNKKGVYHYKKFLELAPDHPSADKVKAIIDAYEATQK